MLYLTQEMKFFFKKSVILKISRKFTENLFCFGCFFFSKNGKLIAFDLMPLQSFQKRLIVSKIDKSRHCLEAQNFGAQINLNNQIDREKTQIVPSSSLMYCNNYSIINIMIKTNKKSRSMSILLLNVSSLCDLYVLRAFAALKPETSQKG